MTAGTPIHLTLDQLHQLAELIADKLEQRQSSSEPSSVEPLSKKEPARLVDAGTLAALLGVSRRYVYEHADELGAVRLGGGAKPRLRFDAGAAKTAMSCPVGERSQAETVNEHGRSEVDVARRHRRLPDRLPKPGGVLAVRGTSNEGHSSNRDQASPHRRAQARTGGS
jgi:hypothetical protein